MLALWCCEMMERSVIGMESAVWVMAVSAWCKCGVCNAGRHSWWTATRGSWFVESLCHELKEAMTSGDVVDMGLVLTRARFQVAYNQETSSSNRAVCGKKQMPSMYSTLTRQLQFPCLHWTACQCSQLHGTVMFVIEKLFHCCLTQLLANSFTRMCLYCQALLFNTIPRAVNFLCGHDGICIFLCLT